LPLSFFCGVCYDKKKAGGSQVQQIISKAIERVRQMESLFDRLQNAASPEDPGYREHLQILLQYYESEQWLQDYALDEQGYLPKDLKRGVLSEDGIYNFLAQICEVTK
jgi:hypothetical protein